MKEGDPFPKTKRVISRILRDGMEVHGFNQFNSTAYFIRDRGEVRDLFFFQKMRTPAVSVAYGVTTVPPDDEDWSPSIKNHKWLENQKLYFCKYVEHAERNGPKIVEALECEALKWLEQFQHADDVQK